MGVVNTLTRTSGCLTVGLQLHLHLLRLFLRLKIAQINLFLNLLLCNSRTDKDEIYNLYEVRMDISEQHTQEITGFHTGFLEGGGGGGGGKMVCTTLQHFVLIAAIIATSVYVIKINAILNLNRKRFMVPTASYSQV